MQTKHTPGPWRINKRSALMVETETGRGIASTGVYSTNTDNGQHLLDNEANARLIAAAPEMLAWLQKMLIVSDNNGVVELDYIQWSEVKDLITKATTQP